MPGHATDLAMEFVAGTPLKGPLPLRDALEYAIQIADALAAAPFRSIVHRGLKPGNMLATEKGTAKVLDFGLAKLAEQPPTALSLDLRYRGKESGPNEVRSCLHVSDTVGLRPVLTILAADQLAGLRIAGDPFRFGIEPDRPAGAGHDVTLFWLSIFAWANMASV